MQEGPRQRSLFHVEPTPGGSLYDRRATKAQLARDFELFWKHYPRKVAKADAEKAFGKKDKDKRLPCIEAILASLSWQVNSAKWLGGFIPNPATYVNQERWDDEPPAKPAKPPRKGHDKK